MQKKLNFIWFLISILLFIILIIDCFFIKQLSFGEAVSEMWEAFIPTILLVIVTFYLQKKK